MNDFDYLNNIVKKGSELLDAPDLDKYEPIGMNRLMSFMPQACLMAEAMNRNIFLRPKKSNYMFYFYGIDKQSRVPFLHLKKKVKEDNTKLIEYAKLYLGTWPKSKIEEILPLIKDKVLALIKEDDMTKGGKKKR
jgi:hypothetical protein